MISASLLFSCSKEKTDLEPVKQEESKPHVCTEMHLPESKAKAASLISNRWKAGDIIKIKFLNGTSFLQSKVIQFASQWLPYANVEFQIVSAAENADIKINFDNSGGSWSYIGKDCQYIAQNQASMNFGWFTSSTTDAEFSRTVTHEFGHALSLIHEHQSPAANISWNKTAVYSYFAGAPNYWSAAIVDANIFYKYSTTQTNYTAFDGKSIMVYSIPSSWTTNGFSVSSNSTLSATDKSFIGQIYPFGNLKRFYRYYFASHHFYTSNYEELGSYCLEGIMGKIYASQVANTYPIYRYYNTKTGDRLSTLNYNELKAGGNGWNYEGVSGYAYSTKAANTIPVYRYVGRSDHFFTTNYNELGAGRLGYKYEGTAFYILK